MGSHISTPTAVACNGNAALCSRAYSSVTQIGTHDSAFVGVLPTENQQKSVSEQLDAGIRFLQAQTHVLDGSLQLCHTSCDLLNAGPLTDYLSTIKTWMVSWTFLLRYLVSGALQFRRLEGQYSSRTTF